MKIIIKEELCPKNHSCPVISVCPEEAIIQNNPFSAPIIESENCADCGLCANYCAYGAITFKN